MVTSDSRANGFFPLLPDSAIVRLIEQSSCQAPLILAPANCRTGLQSPDHQGTDHRASGESVSESITSIHALSVRLIVSEDLFGHGSDRPAGNQDLSNHDFIYASGLLAGGDRSLIEQRIAHLRDRSAGLLFIEQTAPDFASSSLADAPSASWPRFTANEFFALGFKQHPVPDKLGDIAEIYVYSLHNYKTPPQWLNSRYWANPERWGIKWDGD